MLGEGISVKGQVCCEIDFSEECPRRKLSSLGFTKDEREKTQIDLENITDRRFKS